MILRVTKWRGTEPAEPPLCDQPFSVFLNDVQIQITGPVLLPVTLCSPLQTRCVITQKAQAELGTMFAGLCPLK